MPETPGAAGRIHNIQALRALAALLVVMAHAFHTSNSYGFAFQPDSLAERWGISGVDVFFVISGFIMVYTQHHKRRSPARFIQERVARIIPLYWLMTGLLAALLLAMPGGFNALSLDAWTLLRSLFLLARATTDANPLLFVGWTLEFEMLFYVLFALCIPFGRLEVVAALVTLALLALAALFGLHSIAFEFALGMVAGLLFIRTRPGARAGLALAGVGGAAFLATIFLPWALAVDFGRDRLVVWGLPAFLLVLGAAWAPQWRQPLVQRLGDASYSIYLVQVFSIPAFYKLLQKLGAQFDGAAAALGILGCIAATALAGVVLHLAVERPIARALRVRVPPRPEPAPALDLGGGAPRR